MSNLYQVRVDDRMSRPEREIHNLLNNFARKLSDQKWEMSHEIDNWRDTQIHRIDDHAQEQKRLLENEYQKQGSSLNSTRQQFINAARPYEYTRDNHQIDQLLIQCNALKYELAALEFPEDKMLLIQFMTEEQLAEKKRKEKAAERAEDIKSRNKTNRDYDNHTANNPGAHEISSPKLVFKNTKQTNQLPKLTQCTDTPARSSGSNDNRSCDVGSDGISLDECPACQRASLEFLTKQKNRTDFNSESY